MLRLEKLLGTAIKRNNIAGRVASSQMVDAANDWLKMVLPEARQDDARVISFVKGTLNIETRNAAAVEFVLTRQEACFDNLLRQFPKVRFSNIRAHVTKKNYEF